MLREVTPQSIGSVTLPDVKEYYAKAFRPDLTTIVVIGDITPDEAKAVIEKSFSAWTAAGPKPDITLPPVPPNKATAVHVPDPTQVQDFGGTRRGTADQSFSSGLLRTATR